MIEAKDLRIGNWVFNDENKPVEICVIENMDFSEFNGSDSSFVFIENGGYAYSPLTPIPLTGQILLDCGYFKYNNAYVFTDPTNKHYSHTDLESIFDHGDNHFTHNYTGVVVKYLHQLQNIHYLLNGDELIYSPKQAV
jgi:hypothetical protein